MCEECLWSLKNKISSIIRGKFLGTIYERAVVSVADGAHWYEASDLCLPLFSALTDGSAVLQCFTVGLALVGPSVTELPSGPWVRM